MIRHIFFDLDNTLWDHRRNAKLTLEILFKRYQVAQLYQLDFEDFHNEYHHINEELWAKLRDEVIDKAHLREHRFYDTFQKFQIDNFALAQKFEEHFLDEIIAFNEVVPGTFEILDYLKAKNYSLHIITNGFEEVTHRKIEGAKLSNYFSTITSADSVGARKPNPKIFDFALQQAKAEKENSILIGDDWIADVLGAKNYGLDVIFFDVFQEKNDLKDYKKIEALNEIRNFL